MFSFAGALESSFRSGGVRRRGVLGGGPGLVGGGVGELEHPGNVPDQRGGSFRSGVNPVMAASAAWPNF